MDTTLHNKILTEAIAIGDFLLKDAQHDEHGIFWKTFTLDTELKMTEVISDSMYNGASGIAVFLLDLYRVTGQKKYIDAGYKAMDWVYNDCKGKVPFNYGFYTGRTSVTIASLRFYNSTLDTKFLKMASEVLKDIKEFQGKQSVDDLIGGNSGCLLGLLHLHSHTNEKWVVEEINRFVGLLLENLHIGKQGLYWDRLSDYVAGLCGFSHGAAGLCFVFLELGHYTQNKAFYWLAEMAFEYEKMYFDKVNGNWVDLRRHKTNQTFLDQQKEAFFNNDMAYFTANRYMNAWCHGAAGIGLSRLRAYEVLKDTKYLKEAETAIRTTSRTDLQMGNSGNLMIYCHGNCGNADLFIEAYLRLGNKKYFEFAEQIAEQALKQKEELGYYKSDYRTDEFEDKSLFCGIAGIGHYYLRVLMPESISSILMPELNKKAADLKEIKKHKNLNLGINDIKIKIYNKLFPQTINALQKIDKRSAKSISEINGTNNLVKNFKKFMVNEQKKLNGAKSQVVKDIYKLENAAISFDFSIDSNAYLDIKEIIESEQTTTIISAPEHEFLKYNLIINNTVQLYTTKWDWNNDNTAKNFDEKSSEYYAVLVQKPVKTVTEHLSPLSYIILNSFRAGSTVKDAVDNIINSCSIENEDEKKQLQNFVISQIKEFITFHILKLN